MSNAKSGLQRLLFCEFLLILVLYHSNVFAQSVPGALDKATVAGANRDFTYMWWLNGLRDESKVFAIQTSRMAMAFDVAELDLTHLQLAEPTRTEAEALVQKNADLFSKSNAAFSSALYLDGKRFEATGGNEEMEKCRLIESGKFFQRRELADLRWSRGAPVKESGLEVAAWPDRLTLLLRVTPERSVGKATLEMSLRCDKAFSLHTPTPGAVIERDRDGAWRVRLDIATWPGGEEKSLAIVVAVGRERDRTIPRVTANQTAPQETALVTAYDAVMGWHRVELRNDGIDGAPEAVRDRIERVALTVENPDERSRLVRLCFAKENVFGIVGLSAMLRDTDGNPTGIPIQISKNWHSSRPAFRKDSWSPGRYKGPWYRGMTTLTVPPRTTLKLEYTSVNAHWGGVPAASHAQLSLVGWGNNQLWEEAAVGSFGESLCFEPDQGQRGGAVLDTRPLMVSSMGKTPKRKWGWTGNVGGADFLVYYNAEGEKQWNSRMKTAYRRYCPVLTEVTYAGRTHDRKIDLHYTVSLYRTDDIVRGLYRFRYDVREPVDFSRLVLFQCGSDDYSYTGERKFAWGDEKGLVKEWETQWGGALYRTPRFALEGRIPWISMHEAVSRAVGEEAWANRGVVIRSWDAQLGGKPAGPWAAERGAKVRQVETSLMDILPPPDVTRLQPGDYVDAVVEHVVMPQFADDYYGPNRALSEALENGENTWKMIHREAVGNDLQVEIGRGTLLRQRPITIRSKENRAEFTVTGGLGYVPVTIAGLTTYRDPVLEMNAAGVWKPVDQSVHGKDYWQTDFDSTMDTWEITYSVPLDSPGDKREKRSFRFSAGGADDLD